MTKFFKAASGKPLLARVHGAESHWLKSDKVELYLSREGGHLAPVSFKLKHRWVSPFSLPPWLPGEAGAEVAALRLCRGDFFGMPFTSLTLPEACGEVASDLWELRDSSVYHLCLERWGERLPGHFLKRVHLRKGHRAVYLEHRIEGVRGDFSMGEWLHLHLPGSKGGALLGVAPFTLGQVRPASLGRGGRAEYGVLKAGSRFASLDSVELAEGGLTSIRRFPERRGYDDLVMLSGRQEGLGWTAVTFDGYVLLTLKDAAVLPSTLLGMYHGGRHNAPWGGRYTERLALAQVRAYFDGPLTLARKNPLRHEGLPVTQRFVPEEAVSVKLVHAVHPVPRAFGHVVEVLPSVAGKVTVRDALGASVTVSVDWQHVFS